MTQDATAQREDTMLYRSPAPDSDESAVQDIWGKRLEVRTVDASEVPSLLAEGWASHPMDIDGAPKTKQEEAAGFEPVKGKALEAAEKLAAELTKARDEALDRDRAAQKTATELSNQVEALEADNAALTENLKAAEDLANEESKAKEAALARVAELEAAAKPETLTVKKDKPS